MLMYTEKGLSLTLFQSSGIYQSALQIVQILYMLIKWMRPENTLHIMPIFFDPLHQSSLMIFGLKMK